MGHPQPHSPPRPDTRGADSGARGRRGAARGPQGAGGPRGALLPPLLPHLPPSSPAPKAPGLGAATCRSKGARPGGSFQSLPTENQAPSDGSVRVSEQGSDARRGGLQRKGVTTARTACGAQGGRRREPGRSPPSPAPSARARPSAFPKQKATGQQRFGN